MGVIVLKRILEEKDKTITALRRSINELKEQNDLLQQLVQEKDKTIAFQSEVVKSQKCLLAACTCP